MSRTRTDCWLTGGCRCVMIIYHICDIYIYIYLYLFIFYIIIYIYIFIYLFMRYYSISMSTPKTKVWRWSPAGCWRSALRCHVGWGAKHIEGVEDLWIFWGQLQYKLFDIFNGLDINLIFWSNNCLIAKHIRLISNCFYSSISYIKWQTLELH